jgi:5-methylcytosine-specific restriction endonuclease McrA
VKRTPFKRKPPKKKKRKINLKKKLWTIFSEYIRRKDADENGMVSCISCGVVKHYKQMHASHYIPKSLGLSIYFEEKNVHPGCVTCNLFRHGNLTSYAIALRKKYGETILEELEQQRQRMIKISPGGYEELIERYQAKLDMLGCVNPIG